VNDATQATGTMGAIHAEGAMPRVTVLAGEADRAAVMARLRAAGWGGVPIERGAINADRSPADVARAVAAHLEWAPPSDALVAVAPPWWLGVAAQARDAATDPAPRRWMVCPVPDPIARRGRDDVHTMAALDALTRASADWVAPVDGPAGLAHLLEHHSAGRLSAMPNTARDLLRRAEAATTTLGVVLVHHDRPVWVNAALASLACQTRPADRLVVVDAASTRPEARAALAESVARHGGDATPILWRRDPSLGAARMAGADALNTDWVLFMDDDNIAPPEALATFARAATTGGAEIWTCWAALFAGETPPDRTEHADAWYRPLGPVPGLMGRRNDLGDANMLVGRRTFLALGGFDPDPTVGAEDWDFLVRAWIAGTGQRVIPRPLVWKRLSPGSMSRTMDQDRARRRVLRLLRAAGCPV